MRAVMKTVFLAQLNGQTPTGLGKVLQCDVTEAKQHVAQFFQVYNDVETFLWLLRWKVAITGQMETWTRRTRTITAHRWMVEERRVRVLLTYANGDKFWYDVSPIRPSLRTLTCFVHHIWDVRDQNRPKLIYTPTVGESARGDMPAWMMPHCSTDCRFATSRGGASGEYRSSTLPQCRSKKPVRRIRCHGPLRH